MPIVYKVDILAELKSKGISSYRIRKDNIMGERTMKQLRNRQLVSWANMTKICEMLDCQPGDLLAYVPDTAAVGADANNADKEESEGDISE